MRDLDIAAGDKGVFGFGPFLLDPLRRRMTLDGDVVKLPPIQFDTLWVPLWGRAGVGEGRGGGDGSSSTRFGITPIGLAQTRKVLPSSENKTLPLLRLVVARAYFPPSPATDPMPVQKS